MASAQRRVGGLLTGLGQGLQNRGLEERAQARENELLTRQEGREDLNFQREQAIERARAIRESLERREEGRLNREHESGERRLDREADASALIDVIPDTERNAQGVTRGGTRRGLGFRMDRTGTSSGSDDSGMSAGEQRVWNAAMERHTTESLDGKSTDWAKVAATLRKQGYEDLAAMAEDQGGGDEGSSGSPELDEFQAMADEASATARARTGGAAPRAAAPAAPSGEQGSQGNPYKPTDQAEYDAIPSGALYQDPDDGQLYRKK